MSIAITPTVERLARDGAWFAFSVSGGKDSGASLHAANAWLDRVGHPRERRRAYHADLGRAEWPDTIDTVRQVCAHVGVPLEVVSHRHDLPWRFEDRWTRSLARYAALETIALVPPWSSSSLLFCRGEFKSQVLSRHKARLPGSQTVVGVVGLRRQESARRAKAEIDGPDNDMIRRNGRDGILWNPIVDWTTEEVFAYHHAHGIPLHRSYGLGATRLSCAFCVLGSRGDIAVSVAAGNHRVLADYVSLEIRSAFSFQGNAWLCDVAPEGMADPRLVAEAKRIGAERREAQEALPRAVLRAKSIRHITDEDAASLAAIRRRIGDLYGITAITGVTAGEVLQLARGMG